MIPYASRTGTRRNLAELRRYDWRLLVSASGEWRHEGFRYAIDNGAWSAYQQGRPWDQGRFEGVVDALGEDADWIVLPDIVCGGLASLDLSVAWIDRIPGMKLLPVQDGMEPRHVRDLLTRETGIFVGGSVGWKESSLPMWGRLARETGCHLHIGRVNSIRRITLCSAAGADSFDGTCATRYAIRTRGLSMAVRQQAFDPGALDPVAEEVKS